MNEIEQAVRTIAKSLGKHSDQSLLIIVDPDGTFVYEPVSKDFLSHALGVSVQLEELLMRRIKTRAKSLGTEED